MAIREQHPVWIRPRTDTLTTIVGGCLSEAPIKDVAVMANRTTLEDPTLVVRIGCLQFPQGGVFEVPFPLMDAADTNNQQTLLGIETAAVAVGGLCQTCEHRIRP